MEESQAMHSLQIVRDHLDGTIRREAVMQEVIDVAIRCMIEVQEYRKTGSVQTCKCAVEKYTAREPHKFVDFTGDLRNGCPRCFEEKGRNEIVYAGQQFCSVCGQALSSGR